MMTFAKTSEQIEVSSKETKANFLQEVMERLEDGILIVTNAGEIVHANASAYDLCCQLSQGSLDSNLIPPMIWKLCQLLLNTHNLYPEKNIILSDEIMLDKSNTLRVRVRLIKLEQFITSCLLVTIENQYESLKSAALAEIRKYDLTPREAEIWRLYRSHNSYKEIATQLYITINTVKKHMKNIHAKRQAFVAVHQ